MAVTLINDHVLLWVPPDWDSTLNWQREWVTGIAEAVTGAESRRALRAVGRVSLAWNVTVDGVEAVEGLNEAIRAAAKSGLACGAYWGRGSVLQEDVDGDTCEVTGAWRWRAGDYAFFLAGDGSWDVKAVTAVDGDALTLESAVARTYPRGEFVWPLLFGKFVTDTADLANAERASVKLTISELTARDSAQVGELPAPADGIGAWKIGTDFVVS